MGTKDSPFLYFKIVDYYQKRYEDVGSFLLHEALENFYFKNRYGDPKIKVCYLAMGWLKNNFLLCYLIYFMNVLGLIDDLYFKNLLRNQVQPTT